MNSRGALSVAESYLDFLLEPFQPYLLRSDVTDIFVNQPGQLWIERITGDIECQRCPELDEAALWQIARQLARLTHQGISREHPHLAATLPDGSRVQVIAPPAAVDGVAMAIRKHVPSLLSLGDYIDGGAFARTRVHIGQQFRPSPGVPQSDGPEGIGAYLAGLVQGRKNILISGGTASGKTTLLNALMREIPDHERLIFIEDAPELRSHHQNKIHLIGLKGENGEAIMPHDILLQCALRMRPNRIMLGELRGNEAYTFLRAVNTGHPGAITTIHADSPEGAIDQLALIVMGSGIQLRFEEVKHYVRSVVDVVLHMENGAGGKRLAGIMPTR